MSFKINAKNAESKFNEYFLLLVHAVQDDVARDWNGDAKYPEGVYVSHSTLLLNKKQRPAGLKSRFTVSSETRQILTALFTKLINECSEVEIDDNDSIDSIADKLETSIMDCYGKWMFDLGQAYYCRFGKTLLSTGDTSRWFVGQMTGGLPNYVPKPLVIAKLFTAFDSFLKALAWTIGRQLWYENRSISCDLFMGTLAQQNLSQPMLDELQTLVRAKTPAKSPAKPRVRAAVQAAETDATLIDNDSDQQIEDMLHQL